MDFENFIIRNDYEPPCERSDCFACSNGRCEILTSSDFGKRDCPFYKQQKTDQSK